VLFASGGSVTLLASSVRAAQPFGVGNTAEPSGELFIGDIVVVGEVPLTVDRAG
jgi:hypothetical protein